MIYYSTVVMKLSEYKQYLLFIKVCSISIFAYSFVKLPKQTKTQQSLLLMLLGNVLNQSTKMEYSEPKIDAYACTE